ncbi:hypothetical protein [Pseudomonas sp. N040]|uniref:hypothetical protein n=1 Tax=Pseudomonas sp. N040 TaxID=2785325 RepID=UPI0018A28145|nr:hypothetical protein [Pseudomonas sp. N040]MBF7730225.1 hypothetical protein [Pseudomonas sp. N040]MBW7013867.1 hypothetical protein [Pseudomonas sp. N040]
MTYLIDAWLERSNPCLRIIESATGNVCARLDEADLLEMREQGELHLDDLLTNELLKLKGLIRQLFLFCHARTLRPAP